VQILPKNSLLDADGSELLNLYDAFEIQPNVLNFALGTATTDVKKKCLEVLRYVEDNLRGEYMTGVHALVSPEFFDALIGHAKVKEAYERWEEGAALRNDIRSGFTFLGITFEEYRGQATDQDGNIRKFIASGEAHCFPVRTVDTLATYFAPADFNETVNTLGKPMYAKQEPRKFDKGTDLHTQSNPLPMCSLQSFQNSEGLKETPYPNSPELRHLTGKADSWSIRQGLFIWGTKNHLSESISQHSCRY
jgi:hypothetical protein